VKRRAANLVLALLLGSCGTSEPEPAANLVEKELVAMPEVVAAKGCADHWVVTIQKESFRFDREGMPVSSDRLAAFTKSVVPAVRGAVNEACAAGEVDLAGAAAIRTLIISNDSDRDTPKFYVDDPEGSARTSLFDAFASRDFAIPSEMELRQGMQCLTTIATQACQESIQ
jgi:hypothetical protein